jgi:anti-sigma regulatory factor (Ser/Thr protein kinase)
LATSPAFARRALSAWLEDEHLSHVEADAMLAVSELVTNAVVHGGEPISLTCRHSSGTLRIEVFDSDPLMSLRDPNADDQTGGRGLPILAALSDRWGCGAVPGGKVVWAETFTARPEDQVTGASQSRMSPLVL